jgi:hypothetical protein
MCTSFLTDGQLLVTGCLEKDANAWDISAIVKKVGLSDLLLKPTVLLAQGTQVSPFVYRGRLTLHMSFR